MIRSRLRSRSPHRPYSALAVLPLVLALVAPAPAAAELAKWDQERVTAIALDLQNATKELRDSFYKVPPPTAGQAGSKSYYELDDTLRSVSGASRRLYKALKDGKGHEQTFPIYRRMMLGVRDARELAQKIGGTEDVLAKAANAGDALRRIRPYYEEEPAQ
jgi:hypothetical protein